MRSALALAGLAATFAAGLAGQDVPQRGSFRLETRLAFLVTRSEGLTDRPLLGARVGFDTGALRGSRGGLAITLASEIGFGEVFADHQSESLHVWGGAQLPFAVGSGPATALVLVPGIEAGWVKSFGEDERRGFALRVGVGLRVPVAGRLDFGFHPASFVLLPGPRETAGSHGSRIGLELGVLALGWRF